MGRETGIGRSIWRDSLKQLRQIVRRVTFKFSFIDFKSATLSGKCLVEYGRGHGRTAIDSDRHPADWRCRINRTGGNQFPLCLGTIYLALAHGSQSGERQKRRDATGKQWQTGQNRQRLTMTDHQACCRSRVMRNSIFLS